MPIPFSCAEAVNEDTTGKGGALLTVLAAPAVEARSTDLFTPVKEPLAQSLPSADLTLRSRVVTIDLGQRVQPQLVERTDAKVSHWICAHT